MDWAIIGVVSLYNIITLWKEMRENGMPINSPSFDRDNLIRPIEIPQPKISNLKPKH